MDTDSRPAAFCVVASDMDGTLLQPNHTVSAKTADVLSHVSKVHHIPFIFATGRHHVDVLTTKKKLGLAGYVITSNGARVHDNDGSVIIRNDMIPAVAQRLVLEAIDDPEVVTSVYQEDDWLISRESPDLGAYNEDNKDVFFYRVFDAKRHPSYEGVYKLFYTCYNMDKIHALENRIRDTYTDAEVSIAYSLPFSLEVTAGGVNKGVALGQLLDERMFPNSDPSGELSADARRERLLQRCIAFGDGDNDFSLLTFVGKGCVMGNAQEILLDKLAKYVKDHPEAAAKLERIKPNTENGVAEKLKEVFCITEADVAAQRAV